MGDLSNNERIMLPTAVENDDDDRDKEVDINFFRDSDTSININLNENSSENKKSSSSTIKRKSFFCRSKSLSSLEHESTRQSDDAQKHSTHVQFGNVEERIYSLILGDHPECTNGPPTTLSWNYTQNDTLDILSYETQERPFPRRTTMNSLHMSKMYREFLLKDKGYSRMELNDAMRSVKKSVRDRKITNDFSKIEVAAYDSRFSIRHVAKAICKSLNKPLKPILKSSA